MATRYTKAIPEHIYFVESGRGGAYGPYVRPQSGRDNSKFRVIKVEEGEITAYSSTEAKEKCLDLLAVLRNNGVFNMEEQTPEMRRIINGWIADNV